MIDNQRTMHFTSSAQLHFRVKNNRLRNLLKLRLIQVMKECLLSRIKIDHLRQEIITCKSKVTHKVSNLTIKIKIYNFKKCLQKKLLSRSYQKFPRYRETRVLLISKQWGADASCYVTTEKASYGQS